MPTPSPIPQHKGHNRANINYPWNEDILLPAYHLALGGFFHQFGQTESTLSYHLDEFVRYTIDGKEKYNEIIRAILGSRRTKELYNTTLLTLKGAMKSGSPHTSQDIEEIKCLYDHLGEIRFLRDKIAHYAVHPEAVGPEVWFKTVDIHTVREISKAKLIYFKIEHLDSACADLKAICVRLPRALFPERRDRYPIHPSVEVRYEPWQYKPSELKRKPVQLPPNYRLPPAPPESSQE